MNNNEENRTQVEEEVVKPEQNAEVNPNGDYNYDFNFSDQVKKEENNVVGVAPVMPELVQSEASPDAKADPSIGVVNPNPVKPVNVVPVDVDYSAGAAVSNNKPSQVKPEEKNEEVVTSGTATEEEITIDASKTNPELLDEYEIMKDAADMKRKDKKKIIFIVIIFLILFLFILFTRPLIVMLGF